MPECNKHGHFYPDYPGCPECMAETDKDDEIERLRAALLSSPCPCPIEDDRTVLACVEAGKCGCDNLMALSSPAEEREHDTSG